MKKSTLLLSISFIALSAPLMAGNDQPQDSGEMSAPVAKQDKTDIKRKNTMRDFFTNTFHWRKQKQQPVKAGPNNNNNITGDQTRDKRSSSSFLGHSMDQSNSKESISLTNNPQRQPFTRTLSGTNLSRRASMLDVNNPPSTDPREILPMTIDILKRRDSSSFPKSDSQSSLSSLIVETGSRHSINRSEDKKTNLQKLSAIKKERLQEFGEFKSQINTTYKNMYFTQDQLNDFAAKNELKKDKVDTSFFAIKGDVKNLRDYLIAVEKAVSAHSVESYSNPFDLTIRPYNIDLNKLNKFAQEYGVKIENFGLDAQKMTGLMKTYAYYMSEGVYNKDMLRDPNHPSGINMDMLDLVMMWKREFTQGMTEESSIMTYLANRERVSSLEEKVKSCEDMYKRGNDKIKLYAHSAKKNTNVKDLGFVSINIQLDKQLIANASQSILKLKSETDIIKDKKLPTLREHLEIASNKIKKFLPADKEKGFIEVVPEKLGEFNGRPDVIISWEDAIENATKDIGNIDTSVKNLLNAALTELEKM